MYVQSVLQSYVDTILDLYDNKPVVTPQRAPALPGRSENGAWKIPRYLLATNQPRA